MFYVLPVINLGLTKVFATHLFTAFRVYKYCIPYVIKLRPLKNDSGESSSRCNSK